MTISRVRSAVFVLLALVAVGAATGLAVRAQEKIDITGTWIFDVTTDQGNGTPTVILKQEGEKITGHISSMTFGEQDLTGSLKDKALTFEFGAPDVGKVSIPAPSRATPSLKGTLDIGRRHPGHVYRQAEAVRNSLLQFSSVGLIRSAAVCPPKPFAGRKSRETLERVGSGVRVSLPSGTDAARTSSASTGAPA